MNYFLILLILGIGGGSYYEITALQTQSAENHRVINDQETKISELQSANKKLEDDNSQLTVSVNNAQAALTEAKKQVAQLSTVTSTVPSTAAPSTTRKDQPAPVSSSPPSVIKAITTADGKSYSNCQVLKVETDGVVVNYSGGITKILFVFMAPDIQKEFGYDATKQQR